MNAPCYREGKETVKNQGLRECQSGTPVLFMMEGDTRMDRHEQERQMENMMKKPVPGKKVGIIHLQMVKEEKYLYGMGRFSKAEEAVEMVNPLLMMSDRETMVVMSLTVNMESLALEIVAVGGTTSCQIGIGNIFKHALLNNAARIVCFHNHPSGDPAPSGEDRLFTRRVQKAGDLLGIELTDHIIIGHRKFYSFHEHGELPCTGPGGTA